MVDANQVCEAEIITKQHAGKHRGLIQPIAMRENNNGDSGQVKKLPVTKANQYRIKVFQLTNTSLLHLRLIGGDLEI